MCYRKANKRDNNGTGDKNNIDGDDEEEDRPMPFPSLSPAKYLCCVVLPNVHTDSVYPLAVHQAFVVL